MCNGFNVVVDNIFWCSTLDMVYPLDTTFHDRDSSAGIVFMSVYLLVCLSVDKFISWMASQLVQDIRTKLDRGACGRKMKDGV